jgi:4a-hydroxytetrahydrobiopterin dehydratase
MTDLQNQQCKGLEGQPPMSAEQIEAHLARMTGWAQVDGAIERSFHFRDFHQTMAFVNALAWIAHAQDHHPELRLGYDRCVVRFNTHSVAGISINDFICAAKVDALLA